MCVCFFPSRKRGPLWNHEDVSPKNPNIKSADQLSVFVRHVVTVFKHSQTGVYDNNYLLHHLTDFILETQCDFDSCRYDILIDVCMHPLRFPARVAAEWCGPSDGSVLLISPLRRSLIPDFQGTQATSDSGLAVRHSFSAGWNSGRPRRGGSGQNMKQLHAPVMHWFNYTTPDCADRLVLCDTQLCTATLI